MFITSGPDQRHVYHKEWDLSVSLQEVSEYDQEYHNHTLQIHPRHREGVTQNNDSNKISQRQ